MSREILNFDRLQSSLRISIRYANEKYLPGIQHTKSYRKVELHKLTIYRIRRRSLPYLIESLETYVIKPRDLVKLAAIVNDDSSTHIPDRAEQIVCSKISQSEPIT